MRYSRNLVSACALGPWNLSTWEPMAMLWSSSCKTPNDKKPHGRGSGEWEFILDISAADTFPFPGHKISAIPHYLLNNYVVGTYYMPYILTPKSIIRQNLALLDQRTKSIKLTIFTKWLLPLRTFKRIICSSPLSSISPHIKYLIQLSPLCCFHLQRASHNSASVTDLWSVTWIHFLALWLR